jgi:hypothetical protein
VNGNNKDAGIRLRLVPAYKVHVVGWVAKPSRRDKNHRWVSFLNPAYRASRAPPGDDDFPNRWRLIKARFSRCVDRGERISSSRQRKGERGIWQRRYWEHAIRDERDYQRHVDYIHYNPVKHGHVSSPHEWPHSSYMRWVERGMYPANWAAPLDVVECEWE